jgi:mannose-6-phosphate isomerase-like protein (cupin superfamily)
MMGSKLITKGSELEEKNGRVDYPLTSDEIAGRHFAVWTTTPTNPFGPHKHEQRELWFILEGRATVSLDGRESSVHGGDMIQLDPWIEHGLRTETQVRWICMG